MAAPVKRVSTPTDNVVSLVDELYEFRDHYVEKYGLEKACDKNKDVEAKMLECLAHLESVQGDLKNKAQFHMLKGRILNVTPKYSADAEETLSKSVKLDPRLVDAWNHLGECYWKKEDVSAAKNCFTGALNHSKNKVSLRNLSMVLRQLSGPPVEKMKLIEESVERAKEAVQLDIKDGTSWLILGNAYMCQFFNCGQNPSFLKQSMQAYVQAEKDPVARENPDLHFNRAIANQYQEEFQKALEGYHQASQLDPSWEEAHLKEKELTTFLENIQEMVVTKGKTKARKIESLISSLSDKSLGPFGSGQYTNTSGKNVDVALCPLADLKPKFNDGKLGLGVVVCTVPSENPVPFTFCMVDANKTCLAVTIYNMAQGVGMKIGDCVAIPEPLMKKVQINHRGKEISFTCILVDRPRLLVVNGKKMSSSKEALTYLSVSTVSE